MGLRQAFAARARSPKENVMSYGRVISLAAIAALGIACVSADALAARVAARGAAGYHGAAGHRAGALGYRGPYYRPGLGVAAGAAVGGAIAASSPWYGYGGYGYGGYGYGGYGYGGYGYGGYGYSSPYGPSYAGYSDQGYSSSGFIDSRTKAYYEDYCKQRKNYDSSSGTYLGDDGIRYRCP
jgi:hypothetical protein